MKCKTCVETRNCETVNLQILAKTPRGKYLRFYLLQVPLIQKMSPRVTYTYAVTDKIQDLPLITIEYYRSLINFTTWYCHSGSYIKTKHCLLTRGIHVEFTATQNTGEIKYCFYNNLLIVSVDKYTTLIIK